MMCQFPGSAHSSETWSHVRTTSLSSAVAERRCFFATLTRASYRSRSIRTGTAGLGIAGTAERKPVRGLGVSAPTNRALGAIYERLALADHMTADAIVVMDEDMPTFASRRRGLDGGSFHFGTPYLATATIAPRNQRVNNLYLGGDA